MIGYYKTNRFILLYSNMNVETLEEILRRMSEGSCTPSRLVVTNQGILDM